MNRRPKLMLLAPGASPQEAAAIVAALERFMRDTAPVLAAHPQRRTAGWLRAARLEGVGESPQGPTPWGDPHPWGARTP